MNLCKECLCASCRWNGPEDEFMIECSRGCSISCTSEDDTRILHCEQYERFIEGDDYDE